MAATANYDHNGIEIMPSANEMLLAAQSMPNNYRAGLDGYGFD